MNESNELVVVENYQDHPIEFRRSDGYLNLTALCRAFGKRAHDFLRRPTTKELLVALAKRHPQISENLVFRTRGHNGATWIHPELAVEAAGWVNMEFRLWCSETIKKIINGEKILLDPVAGGRVDPITVPLTMVELPRQVLESELRLEATEAVIEEVTAKNLFLQEKVAEVEAVIEPLRIPMGARGDAGRRGEGRARPAPVFAGAGHAFERHDD